MRRACRRSSRREWPWRTIAACFRVLWEFILEDRNRNLNGEGAGGRRSIASAPLAAPRNGSPEWKPSGIPAAAVVHDHGALVSSGFPSLDAGQDPAAPADVRSGPPATCAG